MFQRILAWIKEAWNKMIGQSSLNKALNVRVAISSAMVTELQLWASMYENKAPWIREEVKSLNLPAAIAGEIARAVTIEMTVDITGSPRADYLAAQFSPVLSRLRGQIEKGCAKGGMVLKPYVFGGNILVDFVQADMVYPVSFDATGRITACIFADQHTIGDKYYTRLEFHQMVDGGCLIRNLAFVSSSQSELGRQVDLTAVPDWAELQADATITGIEKPLFAYFKYPLANNIDPTSPLGVSCYSRAVKQIEQADKLWSDFLWEFESAQRAVYADVMAFKKDEKTGLPILPNKRLYRTLDMGGQDDSFFEDWSPTIRQEDYLAGLDAILKKIEFNCGLAYGVLSNPATVDKTATEIKISNQRTYSTITDTQKALQSALEDLLYAMDTWVTLAGLAPSGTYSTAFDWDDSVVVDRDSQFQQDLRLVQAGLLSKVEFRTRNMGEDEKTAQAAIDAIGKEQAPQNAEMFQGA